MDTFFGDEPTVPYDLLPTTEPYFGLEPTVPYTTFEIPQATLSAFQAISGPSILQEGTPQYKAVQYLRTDPFLADFDDWAFSSTLDLAIQHYVILVLYYSTGGESTWKEQLNFLTYSPFCEWNYYDYPVVGQVSGVECNPQDGSVTSIRVVGNDVSGTIPAELGALTTLQVLEISGVGGRLQGTIPPSLNNLSNLRTLSFHNNDLSGIIPPEFANLQALETIHLHQNKQLGGEVPAAFSEISSMSNFRIEGTSITGNLDDIFCQDPSRSFTRLVSDCDSTLVECCCCTACCQINGNCNVNANRAPTCGA
ncbi:MAG: hypothetical protein SGILL_010691 [Bacillariaceae sp.]